MILPFALQFVEMCYLAVYCAGKRLPVFEGSRM